MGRLVKFILYLAVGFLGLLVVASLAVYFFFDPNDFREEISTKVAETTGRELVIEGDLSLSLFPWIAVEVGPTRLGNAQGFGDEPFLSFENARLSVKLLPLLISQEVTVGTASLDALTVNLSVAQDGSNNWDDLAEGGDDGAATTEDDAGSGEPVDFEVDGIRLSNANIAYTDAQAGGSYKVSNLSLTTGRIAEGEPVDLSSGFGFTAQPGDMGGELEISGTLTMANGGTVMTLADLNVSGVLNGIAPQPTDFNLDARSINLDTSAERVSPGEIDIGVLGINIAANVETFSYAGTVEPKANIRVAEFSLKELMQTMDIEAPETSDPNALQKVSFGADADVTETAIDLTNVTMKLDDSTMTGTLSLPAVETGVIRFDLGVDAITLDYYMAPATEGGGATTAAGSDDVEIPVDLIRATQAIGSFRIEQAMLSGMLFENLELGVNNVEGKLRLHPIAADFFDGSYRGDVRIDASGDVPSISANETIADVNLGSMAVAMFEQEDITGTINGNFALGGNGATLNTIRRDLDGTMSFELLDGAWQGTDVWHELRSARALLKGEAAPEPREPVRTEFTEVTATGTVTDGVFRNNDLLAQLPFMQLTGGGSVDLVEASVDYTVQARVLEQPEFATGATEEELADFTQAVIPIKISGPLSSPSVLPDIEGMLRQALEDAARREGDKLKDKLLKQLTGGGNEGEEGDETAQEEGAEAEEEEQPEDLIKDALKNIFDR